MLRYISLVIYHQNMYNSYINLEVSSPIMTNNLCFCAWPDYTTLSDSICEIFLAIHVWSSKHILIDFSSCNMQKLSKNICFTLGYI